MAAKAPERRSAQVDMTTGGEVVEVVRKSREVMPSSRALQGGRRVEAKTRARARGDDKPDDLAPSPGSTPGPGVPLCAQGQRKRKG